MSSEKENVDLQTSILPAEENLQVPPNVTDKSPADQDKSAVESSL